MQDFRNLKVWQLAVELLVDLRKHFTPRKCSLLPNFRRDLMKAGNSISNNIAESCGRSTLPDKLNFLNMSMGSLCETENNLEHGFKHGIINKKVHYHLMGRVALCRRMLIGLMDDMIRRERGDEGAQ